MTPLDLESAVSLGFATLNVGLLTGIFYRLGTLSRAHDDFTRRLTIVEGRNSHA